MHRILIFFVLIIYITYLVEGNNEYNPPQDNINIKDMFSLSDGKCIREVKNKILSSKMSTGKKQSFKRAIKECDKSYKGRAKPMRKNQFNADDQVNDLLQRSDHLGVINLPDGKFTCDCKWTSDESSASTLKTDNLFATNTYPYGPSRRTGYQPIKLQERTYAAQHLKYDDK